MFLLNLLLKIPLFNQWYADYKQFTAFPLLKQPTNIKKLKTKIISIEIIASFIFDILGFSLKSAESFAAKEMMFLAILMLILYFSERVISETYNTYDSFLNDAFEQEYSKESTSIIMELCSKVRNKVFQTDNDKQTIVEHAELIRKTKTYLQSVWKFHWKIPITVSSTLTLVIMIITMVIIEVRNNSGIQTVVILILLLGCTIFYFVTSKKRIKITKQFRKKRRDAYSKEDVLIADINHIEFISQEDFEFHANRFRSQLIETRELTKNERLFMNKAFIQRSFIASTFLILILLIKSLTGENFNMGVILNVVATSTVYSTILQKIGKIMGYFESIADIKIEVSTLYPEFKNIYDVYSEEEAKVFSNSHVSSIVVKPFYATQDPKKTFVLHNRTSFTINAGDCVIVEGPTGCGKSTLLRLLTGQLKMPNNPIVFSNGEHGYLRAIEYQTDNALANNFVIQEITLEEKPENIDRKKLFEILRGLCLYDILLIKANLDTDLNLQNYSDEDKIFALLNMQKLNQFSSGQKQRFALAKLLYTMTTEHQVIALDEAFNRLNNFIAKTCAEFIVDYVHRDGVPRILLFATHQVEIISPLCNKHIAFEEFLGGSNLIVK